MVRRDRDQRVILQAIPCAAELHKRRFAKVDLSLARQMAQTSVQRAIERTSACQIRGFWRLLAPFGETLRWCCSKSKIGDYLSREGKPAFLDLEDE